MNYKEQSEILSDLKIKNYLPKIGMNNVREEILKGLFSVSKYISPKFFYDERGSVLFEQITKLQEYYPTRTEMSILKSLVEDLRIDFTDANIFEFGSGDPSKMDLILKQIPTKELKSLTYFPLDISEEAIKGSVQFLQKKYPSMKIEGIIADFMHQLDYLPQVKNRLFCFFGSTIGNLSRTEANIFMQELGGIMKEGDSMILGVDMVKDINILELAYNDNLNVTDEFNRNIINVINKLISTDFNPNNFKHVAFYNSEQSRIEMHLEALNDCRCVLESGGIIEFEKGERMHTENSYKFDMDKIHEIASVANLNISNIIQDENKWFSIVFLTK